jgi:hypothetical protein
VIVANLCNPCVGLEQGRLTLTPALAKAVLGGNVYVVLSSASGALRGRIVTLSSSTPTLLSFGRSGGNIRPFKASVTSDGRLESSGSGWIGPTGKTVPIEVRKGLLAFARAEGFFTMPPRAECSGALGDAATRFVTISTLSETHTVTVHGTCSQSFEEIYAVLEAAILGASLTR